MHENVVKTGLAEKPTERMEVLQLSHTLKQSLLWYFYHGRALQIISNLTPRIH